MIDQFYQNNYHYCPSCQEKLILSDQVLRCPVCQLAIYHTPAAAVTVIIINNGKILLAKRAIQPKKDYYDTPGGFINDNESAEEAVIRELKEESNLKVKVVRYLGSMADQYQDVYLKNHDFRPTLILFFQAKIISGRLKAADDVAQLEWFDLNKIPANLAFKNTQQAIKLAKQII